MRRIALLSLLAAAALPGAASATPVQAPCQDDADVAVPFSLTVEGQRADGYYALPPSPPKGIVVFAHGHGNSAYKWQENLRTQAARLGVVAVAMDNRGQTFPTSQGATGSSFGWRVREGAADSIAAGRWFERSCARPHRRLTIVMYGVSMGGNTSGLAVAAGARRSDGRTPLFDYWFDIEGVTNAVETYVEARMIAGPPLNNATGQTAVKEFEEENGGSLEQQPAAYADLAVVNHADEIKAGGIKGVVMVHGLDDGTVPYDQDAEMLAQLERVGVPTDAFAVLRHGAGTKGNTLEDALTISSRIPGYASPFTGHGGENDPVHPVVKLGFDRLAELFAGVVPGHRRGVYDDGTLTSS